MLVKAWILLLYQFYQSVSFYWETETIGVESYQWAVLFDTCYFVVVVVMEVVVCVSCFDLLVWDYLVLTFSSMWLTSSCWSCSSSASCMVEIVDRYCLSSMLLRNVLFSPFIVTESFPGCGSWDGTCGFLEFVEQLPRLFWTLGSPLESQVLF